MSSSLENSRDRALLEGLLRSSTSVEGHDESSPRVKTLDQPAKLLEAPKTVEAQSESSEVREKTPHYSPRVLSIKKNDRSKKESRKSSLDSKSLKRASTKFSRKKSRALKATISQSILQPPNMIRVKKRGAQVLFKFLYGDDSDFLFADEEYTPIQTNIGEKRKQKIKELFSFSDTFTFGTEEHED